MVADIYSSWSLRAGYHMIYLDKLALAGDQVDPADIASTGVTSSGDAYFHGFRGGVEYIW